MKGLKIILPVFAALVAAASCKSQYDVLLASNDVEAKYRGAFEYFDRGKYQKAATLFESLAVLTSGTSRDDTVQYYWGLSNYRYKDYYTAESNFASFVSNFPRSTFAEDASFMRIDCLYRSVLRYELDQVPTYSCMNAINEFFRDYPSSPHVDECTAMLKKLNDQLDRKAFENARLYYKMEDYLASQVAFRNILKEDADNIYREDILYYIAMSSFKYASMSVPEKRRERYMAFMDDYLNFVGEMPDSPYRREMDALYARAQRAIGRYAGTDELLDKSERDFEKERKALLNREN